VSHFNAVSFSSASSTSNHATLAADTSNLVVLVIVSDELVLESRRRHRLLSSPSLHQYLQPPLRFIEIYSRYSVSNPRFVSMGRLGSVDDFARKSARLSNRLNS
jgi:hypothetical protein